MHVSTLIRLRNHRKKLIVTIFKVLLASLLFVLLYYQLFRGDKIRLPELYIQIKACLSWYNLPLVLGVIFLMPINWALETKKWLKLMERIEVLPFGKAFKAILAGLTFSLFTPNRIGEYGGRILMVSDGNRVKSVFATLVGSFSQWIVLFCSGFLGLGIFMIFQQKELGLSHGLLFLGIALLVALGIFLLIAYFNLPWIIHLTKKMRWSYAWLGKIFKAEKKSGQWLRAKFQWLRGGLLKIQQNIFLYYNRKELSLALLFSFLRYATYSIQYMLLLYFFGSSLTVLEHILGIVIIYLLQTGIPVPPSTGLLMRGNIALGVFGFFVGTSANLTMPILAATFALWLINVVLPAIVGLFFIVRVQHMGSFFGKKEKQLN